MQEAAVENKFEIFVIYNGVTKSLAVELHQQVQAVLQHAIHLFGITQNPHLLALFKEDGTEVADNQSVAAAGIHAGDHLALRPSAVRGG
jgi:hypothetical protein